MEIPLYKFFLLFLITYNYGNPLALLSKGGVSIIPTITVTQLFSPQKKYKNFFPKKISFYLKKIITKLITQLQTKINLSIFNYYKYYNNINKY